MPIHRMPTYRRQHIIDDLVIEEQVHDTERGWAHRLVASIGPVGGRRSSGWVGYRSMAVVTIRKRTFVRVSDYYGDSLPVLFEVRSMV